MTSLLQQIDHDCSEGVHRVLAGDLDLKESTRLRLMCCSQALSLLVGREAFRH
jgi:hypothetical protein